MPPKKDKELEALKCRRKKAQEKNDLLEEAKLCNAIGEVYMRKGDYRLALHYHQAEVALSEGSGDTLGAGIAHRRVGECLCELGDYDRAIHHQMKHLHIAKETANLAEEQRALATLGRTYFVQSQSTEVGEEEARELRLHAGNANLRSLDVCDKLGGIVADRELLEMRSRLYLNLGLVYQNNGDLQSARKFMEKALGISKELGDSATVVQCHFDLGSLYLQETRPALALRCFREALGVSTEQRSWQQDAEILREMSQAHLLMSNFHEAKSCLKKVVRLFRENSQLGETDTDQRKLSTVRKVIHYSLEMEALSVEKSQEKMKMCEKLGDLCCSIKAFPAAIKFYEQQLGLAEAHGVEPKELSPVYISLARTHSDYGQFSKALLYYEKELELWRGNPTEECDTWKSIAEIRKNASMESRSVMEAYCKAYEFAEKSNNPKREVTVCKAIVEFCKAKSECGSELSKWEEQLERVLAQHPEVGLDSDNESDSENLEHDSGFETPESLCEMETDEEEECWEEGGGDSSTHLTQNSGMRGVVMRRKPRLFKRNEKGETLLHVAAIDGNLTAARQLIIEGADVNARDNCGWLPLHEACNHGHIDLVSCLLDSGANVNDCGGIHCGGISPLMDAASSGHMDIVQLLVLRGADIFHKDIKGHTAVDMLAERLSSATESYELENEHTAIREYLKKEMKKRGWVDEDVVVLVEEEGTGQTSGEAGNGLSVQGSSSSRWRGSFRGRGADRTGKDVLLSSEEEDSPPSPVTATSRIQRERSSSRVSCKQPPCGSLHRRKSANKEAKGLNTTLDLAGKPALISEGTAELEMISGAYPVIDHWLVDDVGQPPSKKRKRQFRDPFEAISSCDDRTGSSSMGGYGSLTLKGRTRSSRGKRVTYSSAPSSHRDKNSGGGGGGVADISGGTDDSWREARERTSADPSCDSDHISPQRSSVTCPDPTALHHSIQLSPDAPPSQLTLTATTTVPAPTPLPLRIRVKIDAKSYLIPCPTKLVDGSDSTIQWLSQQAAERYYTQQGVRPQLSLTTSDGALLSPDDIIVHVLQSGEEVVGVVQHWHLPPLPQRYMTACSNTGHDCHQRALKIFQANPSSPVLDLSHLSLRPLHISPLFTSLQGHTNLTSLNLSGNRLKNDAMTLLANTLARHASLHVLDLSCTGITAQGVENLCNPSSSSSSYHSSPHSTPWSALRALFLGYNPLGPDSGPALSSLLSLTSGLLELGLQSCGLTDQALERHTGLGHALKGLSNLIDVSLSLNPLQSRGVVTLLHSLPTGHLSHLSLANTCTLPTEALEQPKVLEFFKQISSSLELLNLSHCPVDMDTLCRLLQNCQHLQQLRLAAVGLNVDSVHSLCRCVADHPCLKVLDVSGNEGLGNRGCVELLHCCATAEDLRLNLAACNMNSPLPNELITALSKLLAKHRVEVIGNKISQADHMLMSSNIY